MTYENIEFTKNNMTMVDGYFYVFDDDLDVLIQKTDDGGTSFTYPLDTLLTTPVVSLEHDGVNFWTLENLYVADPQAYNMRVRRWEIDNYTCKLQDTITLNQGVGHKYSASTFSVEHYHTTMSGVHSIGSSTIYIYGYSGKVASGMAVTLGPNSSGQSETINVSDSGSGFVILEDTTEYAYTDADLFQFYTNVWLFNNFDGEDSTTGALYKISGYTGSYVTKYPGAVYKDIAASTFYKIPSFTEYGDVDTLLYVKATNLLFVNVGAIGVSLPYYGSMTLDNIESNETTLITIYDLCVYEDNIYRLQTKATYYGSTYSWSNKNYQLSSLNSFIQSITLSAQPGIIAANEVSTSTIVATVTDQFGQPIVGRLVYFTEDDATGYISGGTPVNTDSDGKSPTAYKSGNTARMVKITATVAQS